MAVTRYCWENATEKQLLNCIRWFINKFNMRDWSITLYTSDETPPPWENDKIESHHLADSATEPKYLIGDVWIPLGKHKLSNYNPYQSLMHEMLHILTMGIGGLDGKKSDFVSYRLDAILYISYKKEIKGRIAKIKEASDN